MWPDSNWIKDFKLDAQGSRRANLVVAPDLYIKLNSLCIKFESMHCLSWTKKKFLTDDSGA